MNKFLPWFVAISLFTFDASMIYIAIIIPVGIVGVILVSANIVISLLIVGMYFRINKIFDRIDKI